MIILGLPVKPLIYVERKKLSPEELYKYESEESEEEDEEWAPGSGKKKKEENKRDEMLNECKCSVAIPMYYQ